MARAGHPNKEMEAAVKHAEARGWPYSFSLILSGTSEITVAMADALFEAGCDDASPWSSEGTVSVDFDREAESLGKAVGSAIEQVERAGFVVARVELDARKG